MCTSNPDIQKLMLLEQIQNLLNRLTVVKTLYHQPDLIVFQKCIVSIVKMIVTVEIQSKYIVRYSAYFL